MLTLIAAYIAAAIVFFGIDYLWLSRIAIGFYKSQIGALLLERPNMAAAGFFYLFYVGAIVYFAVLPGLQKDSIATALLNGALLGLIAYGTYDMTNLATLKGWTVKMSAVDMIWGAFLTSLSAGAAFYAASAARQWQ